MQKLQDSVFSIVKTSGLSPAVFSYLEPGEDFADEAPLGGILNDTRHAWLALGNKFCVVDLRTGLKIAAHTFGNENSSTPTITTVAELPTPLTTHSKQLVIGLDYGVNSGMICVFHVNGSQILRAIETEEMVTKLVVCDGVPDGPFSYYDGVVMAGTKSGLVFVFDLDRSSLIAALKDISKGKDHLVFNESKPTHLNFLPIDNIDIMEMERDVILDDDDHVAVFLNDNSICEDQYIFRNPDESIRMKAKRGHVRVTVLEYFPQLGSLAIGYNFGAFQIWNLITCSLEFTSQVNVECLPVTHFGFQEPCDDPRAFCYIWVVFSVTEKGEEEYPLAVMYSLTYLGKRMLSDTKCLYQDFSSATIRFQIELSSTEDMTHLIGGRCVSCHTYSVNSTLSSEGEDSMLNICQLVWECWGQHGAHAQHGMLLFDLDQWYKDQMPATYRLESNAFMSATLNAQLSHGSTTILDVRLDPSSVTSYSHATRLEEHFYPNSLHYNCICLNTSEATTLSTSGVQRQIISSMEELGPTCLLRPARLHRACACAGLAPLYADAAGTSCTEEEQRSFLLSVGLEAKLCHFLKRCARDWATGSHAGAGCTLPFLVDWSWKRALELKENAKELTAPLFTSSSLPDRNVVRCLKHCVQQLTNLTGLLDSILTKCCNLLVPDALSEIEEKYKGIGTVSLYFQVVQWFLRVGLLPERNEAYCALPYPAQHLYTTYGKRRLKLQRLEDSTSIEEKPNKSCSLLYIDQLIEQEFGGDRVHQMWVRAGSECSGLYPPPSLYSLLRLYLLPDIPEEHKHSLVLYLLVDYSMLYDEVRYEAVIRRLMQFPTMFGLSNTAIKATQAFWHLDHRDFDFALDQLQCLTGNTLSDWQHKVVLSSLLAQKRTQAALQYLHVRKPAPIQHLNGECNQVNDHDKLSDWESCCNLYLARALVFEALDVVRMCVRNAGGIDEKMRVLKYFFKGCRNSGLLAKLLQVPLLPFEEEMFVKYLEECNDPQTSDILVMYYLQQSRYLEAEQYNSKLKQSRPRTKETFTSMESLSNLHERDSTRELLVAAVCAALPDVASRVARCVMEDKPATTTHIFAPKPMSVFVQAKSPKNTFTYKSSFIQDTIENASETWINKPKTRKGIKRALNIQDTPFICTPKMNRTRSIFSEEQPSESTPPKRARMEPSTPSHKQYTVFKVSQQLSAQMSSLLHLPELRTPEQHDRGGAGTPHSILKIRRLEASERAEASPVDSRYLCDSEDDSASNHTLFSDSKHLRFTIPTASESGTTPSPPTTAAVKQIDKASLKQSKMEIVAEYVAKTSHSMNESNLMESPLKMQATEEMIKSRKSYKDNVRARLSMSANSSLSSDPNTSIESIADIPVTLINPRFFETRIEDAEERKERDTVKTPKGRRGIRNDQGDRSRSCTPERQDSPMKTLRSTRVTRSRSRTPDVSPRASPLPAIPELPKCEVESEPHATTSLLSVSRPLRSRSRTPERVDRGKGSPKLEVITESPTKPAAGSPPSPQTRGLRSRSRTPEVETSEPKQASPRRSLRARSNTPEKLMSPKPEHSARTKKSLSRIVLEHNAFAKTKQIVKAEEANKNVIECTPMKTLKPVTSLMDVTFSPIVNKSVLQSSNDSVMEERDRPNESVQNLGLKSLPAFTTINETCFDKSVLKSYQSSMNESEMQEKVDSSTPMDNKTIPAFKSINETGFGKSVLHSYESSVAETSTVEEDGKTTTKTYKAFSSFSESIAKSVLGDNSKQSDTDGNSRSRFGESSKQYDATKEPSSLITNDSDDGDDIPEGQIYAIHHDTNLIIRKTKQRIAADEEEAAQKELMGSETDEEIMIGEQSETDDDEDDIDDEAVQKIISIIDTDSEESNSSSSEKSTTEHSSESNDRVIEIDEGTSEQPDELAKEDVEEDKEDVEIAMEENIGSVDEGKKIIETCNDPLAQGQVSLLTDDNSIHSDHSMNLNYSDDDKNIEDVRPAPEVQIQVVVEEIPPTEKVIDQVNVPTDEPPQESIDVTDARSVENEPKDVEMEPEIEKPAGRTRRAKSTSSNKSITDEPKTPRTRKRTQSTASTSSVEHQTPEKSPARSRAITPSSESRRILTRRASKELDKQDTGNESKLLEELTPRRRVRKSKSIDDNASVASDSSVASCKPEVEVKAAPIRKGRKSISTKPDLSVIPEVTVDETTSKMEDNSEILNEYSNARRLTRNQKSVLESWLEARPASRTSAISEQDEEHASPASQDQEDPGTPDAAEIREAAGSPLSTISDLSRQRRSRLGRAASETKVLPKARSIRRVSVDIAATPDPASPAPSGGSGRSRRASFTRACEALHTPKGRRPSTELRRADTDSQPGSPAPSEPDACATPARRRRRASTHSNTSGKSDTGRRSKKTATVDENKDTKKK